MTKKITQQISSIVENTHRKMNRDGIILPIKVQGGILVGDVKILNENCVKHIEYNGEIVFKSINLNIVAINIANRLALKRDFFYSNQIYQEDQKYGKWFSDCQNLLNSYKNALSKKDYELSDVYYARYKEAKINLSLVKKRIESLTKR
jgi:hypothetical protein